MYSLFSLFFSSMFEFYLVSDEERITYNIYLNAYQEINNKWESIVNYSGSQE